MALQTPGFGDPWRKPEEYYIPPKKDWTGDEDSTAFQKKKPPVYDEDINKPVMPTKDRELPTDVKEFPHLDIDKIKWFEPFENQFYIIRPGLPHTIVVEFKKQAIEDSSIETISVKFNGYTGKFLVLQYSEPVTNITHSTYVPIKAIEILSQAGVDKYYDGIIAKTKELTGITIEDLRNAIPKPYQEKPDIEEEPPHEDEDYWMIHPVSPEPEIETDEGGGGKSEKFNWMLVGIAVIGLILLIRR